MKKILNKKLTALFLTTCIFIPLVSCGGGASSSQPTSEEYNSVDQVVNVTAFDKFFLNETTVELYDSDNNLAGSAVTDSNGQAVVEVNGYDEYTVKINPSSPGYYLDKDYKTSKSGEEITVNCLTKLADEAVPNGLAYDIGSIIYDFTYTTVEGVTKTGSELLEENDAIFLNLWYTTCMYCVQEFPILEQASKAYDNVAFVALNCYDESIKDIQNFKTKYELTFDFAQDTPDFTDKLVNAGLLSGFPFTMIIDRYGVFVDYHEGAFGSMLDVDLILSEILAEDYVPEVVKGAVTEEEAGDDRVLPNITMPDSSVIEAAVNGEGYTASYYPETNEKDAPYSWPWIVAEDGESIKPSNYTIDSSFSIIYSDITMPKETALTFEYRSSTEADCDILYVLVDGVIQATISGETDGWQTCYPYVSLNKAETHTIAFAYMKDESSSYGEDTVYIRNIRFIPQDDIAIPVYILRTCYKGTGISGNYLFTNPVYNEEDGYYHVDKADGPLILASLVNSTLWNEFTLLDIARNGFLTDVNGVDYTDLILTYAGYAVNGGCDLVPVTQELKEALDAIAQAYPLVGLGNKEWLLMCHYYSAYGTNGEEFKDPIEGLAPFSAYEAVLGENVINYSSTIVPRGKYAKFVPETSGVYKVYTENTYTGNAAFDATLDHSTLGWIFDSELNMLCEGIRDGRVHFETGDTYNMVMYCYLEANETYYINCCFDDLYRYTDLTFTIEYVGESYDYLRACSPGYFTTDDVDENGLPTGNIVHGGINATLQDDGFYYHLQDDGSIGSQIYCEVIYSTGWVSGNLYQMIDAGWFDFTEKDSSGNVISGEDLTKELEEYISTYMIVDEDSELFGMMPVNARLAEILQKIVDVHGFENVDQGWLKLCYYYEHYGA